MSQRLFFSTILLISLSTNVALAQDKPKLPAPVAGQAAVKAIAQPSDKQPSEKQPGEGQPAARDPQAAQRAAIRAAMQSFAKSFQVRDAKALAAHWTAEGEYESSEGIQIQGREALQQAFAAFFTKTPEVQAEVRPAGLRFLSNTTAIDEGKVTVRRGPAATPTTAKYSALFVLDEQTWRIAQLKETTAEDDVSIDNLSWLIGQWKSEVGEQAEIQTTYAWDTAKKFIQVQFNIKDGSLDLTGKQMIGVDPALSAIHSWTFEVNGGVGEATWRRDGDHWLLEAEGTLPDGSTLTETNVLRRIDDDTFTWQSIDRMLDDVALPDLAPVKVKRLK